MLQFVVLATAWNILGGYAGYVNFGTGAFFAMGAYSAVALFKGLGAPLAVQIVAGARSARLLGFGVGLLTLRLRGIFFAIATVAIAVIMETVMINWRYVGGATGLQLLRPAVMAPFETYTRMLFVVMALLALVRDFGRALYPGSWIGRGLRAIRDSEEAAECSRRADAEAEALRLHHLRRADGRRRAQRCPCTCALSSRLDLQPELFGLGARHADDRRHRALDRSGDRRADARPIQQVVTVTISSEINVLVVGVLLVAFVVGAPDGVLGLFKRWLRFSK